MNTLSNKTVAELRVIAKGLEIVGYGRMVKTDLVKAIEETNAIREAINVVNKVSEKEIASKEVCTNKRGVYALSEITRNIELFNAKLVENYSQEQRFNPEDKVVVLTQSGKQGLMTVSVIFEKANARRQQMKEIAVTKSVEKLNSQESEESKAIKEQYKSLKDKENKTKEEIRAFNKAQRQLEASELKFDTKKRIKTNDWVLPIANGTFEERFEEYQRIIHGIASYGRFKKEYVSALILNNFTDNEPLLNVKMVETRDTNTKETMFSQFITMYMLANNTYTHTEKEMNHVSKDELIDIVFNMEFNTIANDKLQKAVEELALDNPKFPIIKPSDMQLDMWRKIKREYMKREEKEIALTMNVNPEASSKMISAFIFFYQSYLENNAPTYNQVRVYLNILNRNGMSNVKIAKDDNNNEVVKNFIDKLYFDNNISFDNMKTIIDVLINDMYLVKLAKENDEECQNSIILSALKVSKLDNIARRMYKVMMSNKSISTVFVDNTTETIKKQSISSNGVQGVVSFGR